MDYRAYIIIGLFIIILLILFHLPKIYSIIKDEINEYERLVSIYNSIVSPSIKWKLIYDENEPWVIAHRCYINNGNIILLPDNRTLKNFGGRLYIDYNFIIDLETKSHFTRISHILMKKKFSTLTTWFLSYKLRYLRTAADGKYDLFIESNPIEGLFPPFELSFRMIKKHQIKFKFLK